MRILDSIAAFDGLAATWDLAVEAGPVPAPFLLHAWLRASIASLPAGARLAILVSGHGTEVDAALPLVIQRRGPLRIATVLGGDRVSHCDVIGADGPAIGLVLAGLRDLDCDVFSAIGLLGTSRLARDGGLRLTARVTSPLLLLPDGFDAVVMERLTSHDRHDVRRRRRRLAELGEVSYETAATSADVRDGLDDVSASTTCDGPGRPTAPTCVRPPTATSSAPCPPRSPTRATSCCTGCVSTASRSPSGRPC